MHLCTMIPEQLPRAQRNISRPGGAVSPKARPLVGAALLAFAMHTGTASADSAQLKVDYAATFGPPEVISLDPLIASVVDKMSGTASLLGHYSGTYPHLVNFSAGTFAGTATFRAANGDILVIDLGGSGTPTGPTTFDVSFSGVIAGGTGRLAGAQGTVTGPGSVDVAKGAVTGRLEGVITAPGLN